MHKKLISFFITIVMALTVTVSYSNTHNSPLEVTQLFVEKKMSRKDHGIKTTYHLPVPSQEYASGEDVLSESMGLMMLHYVHTQDKSAFERLRVFCEEHLKSKPIYVYREGFSVNALIDDFRLIEALLLAADTFNNASYKAQALSYADVLYETNTANGLLVDFYDSYYNNRNDFLTLCYANFNLISQLSTYDPRWQPIYDKTKAIVDAGFISDSFPLYRNNYNYTTKVYNEDSIHIVHGLKTLLHLAEIGELPDASLQWLKHHVTDGTLYGSYSITGEALTTIQSTAAYAIAAQIAATVNDRPFYEQAIQRMEQYKITDPGHKMFGAFGNAKTQEAYSFDQLTALLAYDAEALFTDCPTQ